MSFSSPHRLSIEVLLLNVLWYSSWRAFCSTSGTGAPAGLRQKCALKLNFLCPAPSVTSQRASNRKHSEQNKEVGRGGSSFGWRCRRGVCDTVVTALSQEFKHTRSISPSQQKPHTHQSDTHSLYRRIITAQ
ncbi:hypothetical protein MHYP_G00059860 [Metynnis hypsauchen]